MAVRGHWMAAVERALGFIGAGQMATALAYAWTQAGLTSPQFCRASDPSIASQKKFTDTTGWTCSADNTSPVRHCQEIVLAVKPQVISPILAEIKPHLTANHLIISIIAGVSTSRLQRELGENVRIVRVMPNTPCLVAASATGIAAGSTAQPEDVERVEQLFSAVGKAYRLPEPLLDAVTGLSGSGPAYVYVMIEALADGGVLAGLPRDVALNLAAQTVLGAAKMILETGQHPGILKDAVASPAGTTIAGLHALEQGGFRGLIMDAVQAATQRATELGAK